MWNVLRSWASLAMVVICVLVIIGLFGWFAGEVGGIHYGVTGRPLSEYSNPGEMPDYKGLRQDREAMAKRGIKPLSEKYWAKPTVLKPLDKKPDPSQ